MDSYNPEHRDFLNLTPGSSSPEPTSPQRIDVGRRLREYPSNGSLDSVVPSTIQQHHCTQRSRATSADLTPPMDPRRAGFHRRNVTSPELYQRNGLPMSVQDQRHPGNPGRQIHLPMRQLDTDIPLEDFTQQQQQQGPTSPNKDTTIKSRFSSRTGSTADDSALPTRDSQSNSNLSGTTRADSEFNIDLDIDTNNESSLSPKESLPSESSSISLDSSPPAAPPPETVSIINNPNPSSRSSSEEEKEETYVKGLPLLCLITGLMLAVFLISIDRTIISTAIPYITSEFSSTPDIGWYGSSYLLTACAFQPVFGRIYMIFDVKKAYLIAMFLFELGSLICGVAPSSLSLIVGRAIAGLGCAGILTGSFVVVATAVPLRLRPVFIAVVGVMFGVGATCGPLLGGVFTDLVTWRWCFYINLPVGGATVIAMILFFHPTKKGGKNLLTSSRRTFWDRLLDLDILGNILLLGASIMLFLALEFTTLGTSWSSPQIIGLLVGFGATSLVFSAWQQYKGEDALMPPRIVSQRTVAASCGAAFMTYGALINLTFFLPIWFQAIKNESAIMSGVNMIPYFATNAFFSLLAGVFVAMIGYVTPPAVVGSAIGTAGLGLLAILLDVETTTAQWVGYEILASAGFGLSIQQGFTAVQTVLGPEDMAIGTAVVVASQSLGGAIFLSVGNSVFQSQLQKAAGTIPGVDIKKVIDSGAASFRDLVPAEHLPALLEVYNKAIRVVFTVSIPLGGLAAIISCFMEWKSVKVKKEVEEEVKQETTVDEGAQDETDRNARARVSIGGWRS